MKNSAPVTYEEEQYPSAQKTIRKLKEGDFFRLRDTETSPVWIRGKYVPELRKYSTYKFDDVNHEQVLKGDTLVFVGFTF